MSNLPRSVITVLQDQYYKTSQERLRTASATLAATKQAYEIALVEAQAATLAHRELAQTLEDATQTKDYVARGECRLKELNLHSLPAKADLQALGLLRAY